MCGVGCMAREISLASCGSRSTARGKKKESNLLPTVSCGLFSRPICEFNCCNSWSN